MKMLLILSASASVLAYGIGAVIALMAFVYLVYVLIKPEKF
ncbi:K+-transporting ATPase, KdpF subunit [Flexibacter flexilis DSM 6793]|uniref:K+-transporting ATPase, KdpF subunit n=1 Tax=Flexibacter flexilis DSM 6793 TaxID=927664 RepID=A0A1I1DUP6_9BACT|nr:K(+)-transporting ATPase subunit F [Flexibacter flexilis]SFB78685.1 K+-transporting ATPase, KdpF subunit [Flexibacter flexilis DSM 6793]